MTLSIIINIINKMLIILSYSRATSRATVAHEKHSVSSPKKALKPLSLLYPFLSLINIIKHYFTKKIVKNTQINKLINIKYSINAKNRSKTKKHRESAPKNTLKPAPGKVPFFLQHMKKMASQTRSCYPTNQLINQSTNQLNPLPFPSAAFKVYDRAS